MFTKSIRVGCSFQACPGESVKNVTCLIFLWLLLTHVTDPNFIHLATDMSVNWRQAGNCYSSWLVDQWNSLICIRYLACPKYGNTYCMWWQSDCAGNVTVQPVTLAGLSVSVPRQGCKLSRPVGNFYQLATRVGNICNWRALNWNRQAVNNNRQACNTSKQAGNCNQHAGNIFASYGLSVSKCVAIKRPVGRHSLIFGLWLVERQVACSFRF